MKYSSREVLCISDLPKSKGTIKRHYERWRSEKGIPIRCDQSSCMFYASALIWNNYPLKLILDHISGNTDDNTPENLRFLCPNCDSQLTETKGGANKGRIQRMPGGSYMENNRDNTRHAHANADQGSIVISIGKNQ